MPNFDRGHYFLTALIPMRNDPAQDPLASERVTSHVHCLREKLARLPTALQTPATEGTGLNSPFARDPRTHFARLVVLDDVAFNGRDRRDAVVTALKGPLGGLLGRQLPGANPVIADPVDHMPHPWLVFVCDFDAASGEATELESYLRGLWEAMGGTWADLLQHCQCRGEVKTAEDFIRLVKACQVETTMPFNDYYVPFPALTGMSLTPVLAALGIPALALVVGVLGGLVAAWTGGRGAMFWWAALAGLVLLPLAALWSYRRVVAEGQKPLPTGARTDLISVMKALYLQHHVTRFAIAQQGAPPEALHAAFGAFLAAHRPDDPRAPTQARGTVRSGGRGRWVPRSSSPTSRATSSRPMASRASRRAARWWCRCWTPRPAATWSRRCAAASPPRCPGRRRSAGRSRAR